MQYLTNAGSITPPLTSIPLLSASPLRSLNIYASNDDNFKELEENVPKKIKDVIIEKQVNGFQFRSYNLTTILRLQKSLGFNFKLEHV